jgi:predicted lipoprotein with Yx(FWY)xxD motif
MQGSTTRTHRSRSARGVRRSGVAAVCAGVLALGALGVGGTAAYASKAKTTVAVAKVKGVGTLLVDSKGKTLYTLTDAGKALPCTGDCLTFWPPLNATGTPKGAKGVTGLALVSGGKQVTADGLPLYRYSGDAKKGQANGEGVSSFGGVWHAVTTDASPTTGGTKSSSSGGYGY